MWCNVGDGIPYSSIGILDPIPHFCQIVPEFGFVITEFGYSVNAITSELTSLMLKDAIYQAPL
jgi:hypothetical protein